MKVHELLSDQSKWTQETLARSVRGVPTSVHGDAAACWCLSGAIMRCYGGDDEEEAAFTRIEEFLDTAVTWWNDRPERTFEEVRELVTRLDI